MERLSPVAESEPLLPDEGQSGASRVLLYTMLAVLLGAGGFVRFHDTVVAWVPSLAGAGAADGQQPEAGSQGLVELASLPQSAAAQAIAGMDLPAADAAMLAGDVQRERVQLVRLPLFDAGGAAAGAGGGQSVEVSAGGYTSLVHLARTPVVVVLPISRAGTVSFRLVSAEPGGAVGIGALTAIGPVRLPDLASGQALQVSVLAQ